MSDCRRVASLRSASRPLYLRFTLSPTLRQPRRLLLSRVSAPLITTIDLHHPPFLSRFQPPPALRDSALLQGYQNNSNRCGSALKVSCPLTNLLAQYPSCDICQTCKQFLGAIVELIDGEFVAEELEEVAITVYSRFSGLGTDAVGDKSTAESNYNWLWATKCGRQVYCREKDPWVLKLGRRLVD